MKLLQVGGTQKRLCASLRGKAFPHSAHRYCLRARDHGIRGGCYGGQERGGAAKSSPEHPPSVPRLEGWKAKSKSATAKADSEERCCGNLLAPCCQLTFPCNFSPCPDQQVPRRGLGWVARMGQPLPSSLGSSGTGRGLLPPLRRCRPRLTTVTPPCGRGSGVNAMESLGQLR